MSLKELMKGAFRGITGFFTTQRVVMALLLLIVGWILLNISGKGGRSMGFEGMESAGSSSALAPAVIGEPSNITVPTIGEGPVSGAYKALDTASPSDLLPNDMNNAWSNLNPTAVGDIATPDLLSAGYHIGITSQTNRIPNLQLRADPVIEKIQVSPWNQAVDVEPDYLRAPIDGIRG